jgi:hypothetical protein
MSTDGRSPLVRLLASCVLLLGLAGCSNDAPARDLDLGDASDSSPAASGGESGDPSGSAVPAGVPEPRPAPTQGEKVDDDYGVWSLRLPGKDPAKLVGQTLVDYMEVRTRAFHTRTAPLPELARVAVGQPLTDVQGYVLDLREAGLHTVGDVWFTITDRDVQVRGARATVNGVCMLNATVDASEQDVAQESPPDAYRVRATAVRAAPDVWLISKIGFVDGSGC